MIDVETYWCPSCCVELDAEEVDLHIWSHEIEGDECELRPVTLHEIPAEAFDA
jgi:hypothetical protein